MAARKPTKKQRETMAAQRRGVASSEFRAAGKVLLLCLAALLLDHLPILDRVLGLLETYFHEIGHAIVGQLTGRRILVMELNWNGSGLISHEGGTQGLAWISRTLTAWWGYAGAIAAGTLFYWLMTIATVRGRIVLWTFAAIVLISLVWLARDVETWIIGLTLAATLTGTGFALQFAVGDRLYPGKLLVRFIGVALVVLSMKSAWALWGISPPHDAASLAQITLVFQFIWILSWELFGFACLYLLFRREIAIAKVG